MTDLLIYEFNNNSIEFLMTNDVMVNATQMGAIYNKHPNDFLQTKGAKDLIATLKKRALGQKKNANIESITSGLEILDAENIIYSSNSTPILLTSKGNEHGGIWMHRWLAMDYAMSLDVEFKIWVLERIDYLFVSYTQAQRKLVLRENQLQTERRKLIEANESNAAVIRLANLDEELKDIRNKKSYETRKTYNEWKMQL